MRNIQKLMMIAMGVVAVAMISCDKHVYDEEKYRQIIRYLSPIDSVDQRHDWKLTQHYIFHFTADAGSDIESVKVFTADPLTDSSAELMNQTDISQGETETLSVSAPSIQNTLWAALVDKSGNYYVTSFSTDNREVSFADATVGKPTFNIWPQTYTYLFEEDFPQPGDYDYNDLVLRISQQRTGKKEITLRVTVAAVGASYQMEGCLRLIGYRFEDIDSVKTTTGATFDDGVPAGSMYILGTTDMLLRGLNDEAVLHLFVDAHWAMAFNAATSYGLFKRKKYNVRSSDGEDFQERAERTISYVIYFNSEEGLNHFTLDSLDPFIITQFNSSNWETHLDNVRDAKVFYEYETAKIKDLPWALLVPSSSFQYPYEGTELGFKKKTATGVTAMFGAYVEAGHSFGEWAENYESCHDWYLYPNLRKVY